MEEMQDNMVVLTDENGEEHSFEHLGTFDLNGNCYVALGAVDEDGQPVSDEEDEYSTEVVFVKLVKDEKGEDSFELVEDEAELDKVFDEFQKLFDDEDFEEDGEE